MSLSESLTVTFTGLLCLATIIYVIFTRLLWKVSQAQKSIQSDLRDLQLLTQKHTLNPELRAYCGWDCDCSPVTQSNGPGTPKTHKIYEIWKTSLHLWNTGSSTILVTDWSLEAGSSGQKPQMRRPEGGFTIKPPIAVPAHSSVQLQAEATGFECRMLRVSYDTCAVVGKVLPIPLKTSFGYQNKEEAQENG
jgi:hypothetical protein